MKSATLGPSPGKARDPGHEIHIEPADGRWSARLDGELLAQSSDALLLAEAGYDPVVYFPPADVLRQRLAASGTRTQCPFKGEAHYYSATSKNAVDVAWFYPEVYDEVAPIADYVAFYADRVHVAQER